MPLHSKLFALPNKASGVFIHSLLVGTKLPFKSRHIGLLPTNLEKAPYPALYVTSAYQGYSSQRAVKS